MLFYDANLSYGTEVNEKRLPPSPCRSIVELCAALARCGIRGGLVRTLMTDMSGVAVGNRQLAEDLKTVDADLSGMYTLVPSCTHEIPSPEELPAVLKRDRMPVLRINPKTHRFMAKPGVLADYYAVAESKKIPVMLDTACGVSLEEIWDIMERFPKLTAILGYTNIWPADRYYRPFLEAFPNLRMELSFMITDQGIEELVKLYGAKRFLFASRFPSMSPGGGMLQLRCAEISEADKARIAGENFREMIGEVLG